MRIQQPFLDLRKRVKETLRNPYLNAYRVGNELTHKTLRRDAFVEVPLDICVTPFGFPFVGGWHPLTELLKQYDSIPGLTPGESVLATFHATYCPNSGADLVGPLGKQPRFDPPLGVYPWGASFCKQSQSDDLKRLRSWYQRRWCGPSPDSLIEAIFRNTIRLRKQIDQVGYRPWDRGGMIRGSFLRDVQGRERFVVIDGNHRMAVLAHLGHPSAIVGYLPSRFRVVKETQLDKWCFVRSRQCSEEDALSYFHLFFKLSGYEQLGHFGMVVSRGRTDE